MAQSPTSLSIRTYNVGFGDCFLLSFKYSDKERHVLIDFGSKALPPGVPKTRMMDIARDISERTKGLTAVIATHRHQDHISGFATRDGKASGDIIAALKPKLVMQPWTENPKLAEKAKGPADQSDKAHVHALAAMNMVADRMSAAARKMPASRYNKAQLQFIGEDNVKNLSAVKNLASMAPKCEYLYCGSKTSLESLLPGVTVDILGPPTVNQHDAITKERSKDPNEFWHLQARTASSFAPRKGALAPPLFPRHVRSRGGEFPAETRWFVYHSNNARDEDALRIVTALDDAMNNTSIILLLRIGKKTLLFPGDAQIENWEYALGQDKYKKLLKEVTLYKVGHHGSLNATPKTLWALFNNRSTAGTKRMASLMSTLHDTYGSDAKKTEVPRKTLHAALKKETDLFTTEDLKGKAFWKDTVITF